MPSILGIVGVFPTYLAAIAVIGLGAILPCSVSDNHHISCWQFARHIPDTPDETYCPFGAYSGRPAMPTGGSG